MFLFQQRLAYYKVSLLSSNPSSMPYFFIENIELNLSYCTLQKQFTLSYCTTNTTNMPATTTYLCFLLSSINTCREQLTKEPSKNNNQTKPRNFEPAPINLKRAVINSNSAD